MTVAFIFGDATRARPGNPVLGEERFQLRILICQTVSVLCCRTKCLFQTLDFLFEGFYIEFLAFAMCSRRC